MDSLSTNDKVIVVSGIVGNGVSEPTENKFTLRTYLVA